MLTAVYMSCRTRRKDIIHAAEVAASGEDAACDFGT